MNFCWPIVLPVRLEIAAFSQTLKKIKASTVIMTINAMCFQKIVYSVTQDDTLKVELSQLNMTFIETQEIIRAAQFHDDN